MVAAVSMILAGYLCGSVLFARLCADLLGKSAILRDSKDANPGAANAFQYGGFWWGVAVLLGDLGKGALPVWLCFYRFGGFAHSPLVQALILAAPVLGHVFPLWYGGKGGKGIAVTFGVLLGLMPMWKPAVLFALVFLFHSLILRITPHFYRTAVTYPVTAVLLFLQCPAGVWLGFWLAAAAVLLRLHGSNETREEMTVKLLWKS